VLSLISVVTKAVEKVSKQLVALKKLIMHNERDGVSVTTVREIKILKALDHPNVVPIRDMVVDRTSKGASVPPVHNGRTCMLTRVHQTVP
jgi:serine/threonine protein kinase